MCAATIVVFGAVAAGIAPDAGADHLAPVVVETNAPEVVVETAGSVGTETACPGGWSGGSAQILGNVTAHLSWTFTVPSGHTGVVTVVGYRDPTVARPFYMWLTPDPMVAIPNAPTGVLDCRAALASTASLPAGTYTINVSGHPDAPAYLDFFRLVTTSVPGPTGSLVVAKTTDTPGTFNFTVNCPGSTVLNQPVAIAVPTAGPPATSSTPITGIPVATMCTVTETTAPGFTAQAPQNVTIATGTNTVTFANVRETGSLAITKVSDTPGAFDFTVNCAGTAVLDRAVAVTVAAAGGPGTTSTAIPGIPTGTVCTVTETTAPGFDPQPPQNVTIVVGVNTVRFTNVRQTGNLIVSKTAVGGTGTFSFSVDCTPGTAFDQTFNLTGTSSRTITGIPTGTSCVVTEAASATFTSVSTPANGTVTITTGDNTVSFVNTIRPPVLTLTKVADAATVTAGAGIGFTVTAANTGPNPATAVTLNDPLPAATGVSWTISPAYAGPGTCTITGAAPTQVLTCSFGNLAPAAGASVHVSSTTTAATSGALANTATVQATNHAPVTAAASVTVNRPNLTVTKTADAAAVTGGGTIGYTVVAANAGPGVATGASINDPLPSGTGINWSISPAYAGPGSCSITGAAPNQVLSCALGNLASGASASVHVSSATATTTAATLVNAASVLAANHATVTAAATITVTAVPVTTTTTTTTPVTTTRTTTPVTTIATTTTPSGGVGDALASTASTGSVGGDTLPRTGSAATVPLTVAGWLFIVGGVVLMRRGASQPVYGPRGPRRRTRTPPRRPHGRQARQGLVRPTQR